MKSLRVLIVGDPERSEHVSTSLMGEGYSVIPVEGCNQAAEALEIQKFDAVLLGSDLDSGELPLFAAKVSELNRRSSVRTALLRMSADSAPSLTAEMPGIDECLSETADAGTLTAAISRLAAMVGQNSAAGAADNAPEDVILEVDQLKEQVAFDDELLVELIDLYFSERSRQSVEMAEALAVGDCEKLSRVAHTIKGSLGSLHAPTGRLIAQALETTAKEKDIASCRILLPSFELALNALHIQLMSLKTSLIAAL